MTQVVIDSTPLGISFTFQKEEWFLEILPSTQRKTNFKKQINNYTGNTIHFMIALILEEYMAGLMINGSYYFYNKNLVCILTNKKCDVAYQERIH